MKLKSLSVCFDELPGENLYERKFWPDIPKGLDSLRLKCHLSEVESIILYVAFDSYCELITISSLSTCSCLLDSCCCRIPFLRGSFFSEMAAMIGYSGSYFRLYFPLYGKWCIEQWWINPVKQLDCYPFSTSFSLDHFFLFFQLLTVKEYFKKKKERKKLLTVNFVWLVLISVSFGYLC